MDQRALRAAGIAGLVFIVVILASVFMVGSPPAPDDPAGEIRDFFVDQRSMLLAGVLIQILATPLFLWFLAALRNAIAPGDHFYGTLILLGGIGMLVVALVANAIVPAAVYVEGFAETLGDDVVVLVFNTQMLLFAMGSGALVAFTAAVALAGRRARSVPSVIVWLGGLAAVLNVVGALGALSPDLAMVGFLGFLSFSLLVILTSITMAMGKLGATTA